MADTRDIAIVGAGSLRGKDLKELLESSSLAASRLRLFDEDIAVGTLTRAGDEPAIIAAVDESSFEGAGLVFFAGRPQMAQRHAAQAASAGARVIDLSEDPGLEGAKAWVPAIDSLAGRPSGEDGGREALRSPSGASIIAASVTAALGPFRPTRLVFVFLRPVSERGQEGIDELERQTVSLLSFRAVTEEVYGAQVAFNLIDTYGPVSEPSLDTVRRSVERDVATALGSSWPNPAPMIQILQAPVFHSYAFTAYAELGAAGEPSAIESALMSAGLSIEPDAEPRPSSMNVAGKTRASLGKVRRAEGADGAYWIWGAADNLRLVAANAVAIAETLRKTR